MPFIPFEEVEALATIEQLAEMLGLATHKYGANQIRCSCPVHGGDKDTLAISPAVKSKRGSLGVFFCQAAKSGGDRIGLVAHCMQLGQQDAAYFIQEQLGADEENGTSTVESTGTVNSTVSKTRASPPPKEQAFDAEAYAAKLTYTEQVAALGISEEDAARLSIGYASTGIHRGRVVFPVRNVDGSIAGFVSATDLKVPTKWQTTTVIPFQKRA